MSEEVIVARRRQAGLTVRIHRNSCNQFYFDTGKTWEFQESGLAF